MTPQELKEIEGWEEYGINKEGRIFSFKRDKFLTPYRNTKGYLRVNLRMNGGRLQRSVARLVLEAFVGPCPIGTEAAHMNGIKTDNRLENLKWCTHKENVSHMVAHGTMGFGEKNSNAKITNKDANFIRESSLTLKVLSKKFGVSESTISLIKNGIRWNVKNV